MAYFYGMTRHGTDMMLPTYYVHSTVQGWDIWRLLFDSVVLLFVFLLFFSIITGTAFSGMGSP